MAGSLTNTGENQTLDWLAANKLVYTGLFTVAPDESSAGTEVAGNAYARQPITWGAAAGGAISNTALVQFPSPTPAGWGAVVGHGFFVAVSGGTCMGYADQTPSKTINIGDDVEFAIGDLDFTLD